jgi:CubicO group peptidase (beta-lactamase class C family)
VHRREAHARRLAISHTGGNAVESNSRLRDRSGVGAGLRLILSAAACVMLFTTIAAAATSADCSAPAVMSDGWAVSSPAEQGLNLQLVCSIGSGLAMLRDADPHGVVVIRHRVLVYERYFTGEDLRGWTPLGTVPHDANTLHNTESITKGVVALLVGVAFDRGWLHDLDAPIFSFLPEYADLRSPDKDRITLRHLLSMTSGLDWPERALAVDNPANIVQRGRIAPDPYRFVLERSVVATPGLVWNYNGGGVWLLGLILSKVSGQPLDDLAKAALFEPLGINDWEWQHFPNGGADTSGGLRLRPRDLAKLGQLVLDGGAWRGRLIVSAHWVQQMTARQSPRGSWFGCADAYGYLWVERARLGLGVFCDPQSSTWASTRTKAPPGSTISINPSARDDAINGTAAHRLAIADAVASAVGSAVSRRTATATSTRAKLAAGRARSRHRPC